MRYKSYEPEVLVEDITALTEEEWKQYRYQGIGGSDVAAVCGISPWKTTRDLYEEKVQKRSLHSDEDGWVAKEIGKRLEELVVQIFMKKTGLRPYAVRKMFRHPAYPFMLADVDYFVEIDGEICIIECKTTFSFNKEEWENGGIPRHYELQGRHYMAVANVNRVIFLCLYGNNEETFFMRSIHRDHDLEDELIEQETWFWNNNVLAGNPPEYMEKTQLVLKSIRDRLGIREGEQVELSGELSGNVAEYLKLKKQKSELDKQVKVIDEQMKRAYAPVQEVMKGAEKGILVLNGVRYQAGYTKRVITSINKDAMEAMRIRYPDICEEYAKTSVSRSFYIKLDKAS